MTPSVTWSRRVTPRPRPVKPSPVHPNATSVLQSTMDNIADQLARVLGELGLNPMEVRDLAVISRRHGSRLYRLRADGRNLVLKWQAEGKTIEPRAYELLKGLRVPTLPFYARTDNAVLLENLEHSPTWRLASERDISYAQTGQALAEWYQFLHLAGRDLVSQGAPEWLRWEWEPLTADSVRRLGRELELSQNPLWEAAARHVSTLKQKARQFPLTLNYNDFHWSNLALSRQGPTRAIVFDYHLLGIGLRWSDCRNVCSGLGPAAEEAFLAAYGPIDQRERALDSALAPLAGLQAALWHSSFPPWARAILDDVESGRLQKALQRAIAPRGEK